MRIAILCSSILFLAGAVPAHSQEVQVTVDSVRKLVIVTASPLHIPVSGYGAHFKEKYVRFSWPATGWVRGYQVDLVDSAGNKLSRNLLHHAGMANLERKALVTARVERVFAVGRETAPIMLPGDMGVPFSAGSRISLYYALANQGPSDVHGAMLRFTFTWIPESERKTTSVLPVFLGAHHPDSSVSFDVPPGLSMQSSEFTMPISGRFRAMGAHMHDYAKEIRLEDVESNRVLVRLRAEVSSDGKILGMERTRFILARGLRLDANKRYRVVAVYNNPTCSVSAGAMGLMVGPFIPDDIRAWPAVDPNEPGTRKDIDHLTNATEVEHHHAETSEDDYGYGSKANTASLCGGGVATKAGM